MRLTTKERRIRVYKERNAVLRSMGFKNYAEYRASELWQRIRARVLAERPDCEGCGKPATQVHHSAYRKKDLEGRDLRRLHPVCGSCHFRAEFSQSGEKTHPKQATSRLKQIATVRHKRAVQNPQWDQLF